MSAEANSTPAAAAAASSSSSSSSSTSSSSSSSSPSSNSPSSSSSALSVPAGHVQLYVKNLAFSSTDVSLLSFVESKLGNKPHSVHIVTRRAGNRSRGFGFVTLISSLQQKAIDSLDGQDFEGRTLSVVEAKARDPNAPPPQRKPVNPNRRRPRTTRSDNFPSEASSSSSSSSSSTSTSTSSSSSSSSSPPKREREPRKSFPDATQLYVNNLSFSSTADEVSTLFESKLGAAPLHVDIVRFSYGRLRNQSRGFGFVFVPNSVLDKALALDKTKLNDRELGIQLAKPPSHNNNEEEDEIDNTDGGASSSAPRPRRRGPRRGPRRDGPSDNNEDNNNSSSSSSGAPLSGDGEDSNDAPDNRRRREGEGARGRRRPRRGGVGGAGRGRGGGGGAGRGGAAASTGAATNAASA